MASDGRAPGPASAATKPPASTATVDAEADSGLGTAAAYQAVKWTIGPALRFLYKLRVEGAEHVPESGPVILASNHVSFCDSIFLPLVVPRRVTFVAKAEYFDDPKTAWFFRAVGQIPVRRGGGPASQRALESAAAVLDAGQVFGIYPEGTRSPDGRLYKGHTGVARLAVRCGAPVVAAAMIGTREAQPIGQVKPRFFMPITVRFSRPLSFDRYRDRASDPMVLRQITDEIMFELRELSGQEYVHQYAKRGESPVEAPAARVLTHGGNGAGAVPLVGAAQVLTGS